MRISQKTMSRKPNTIFLPMFLCWLTYTASYLGRYSYSSNITPIMEAFQTNRADTGLISTCFFVSYGIGQVVNGILCKYYPKRFIIGASLLLSAVINLTVYLGVPFSVYKYLWFVNGIALSVLWPTLVYILSDTLTSVSLNKAAIVMSSTVPVGTLMIYGISALFAQLNYKLSFLAAAIALIAVTLIWFIVYPNAFTKSNSPQQTAQQPAPTEKLSSSLLCTIFVFAFFAIGCNLVKDGLSTWVPAILKENFGLTDSLSILLTLVLPVLGFFSAAINAYVMRKGVSFIKLSGLYFFITVALIGLVISTANTDMWILILLMFGLISLFTHGINGLITSMAPLHMRDKINSGLLAGILNGCCYIGSALSSYGLGFIADNTGWNGVFWLLLAVCAFNVLLSVFAGKIKVK